MTLWYCHPFTNVVYYRQFNFCGKGRGTLRTIRFHITDDHRGKTVEQFLKGQGISRRVIISLKRPPDGILVNGAHARTIDRLEPADILEINLPATEKRMPLCDIPVPILYEDEDVLVYNKPPGMPCHQSGGHIHGTLSGVWAAHCAKTGTIASFRALNRLDKDTTGTLVAAKNQLAAGKLWKAVSKVYVAAVAGLVEQETGVIRLPIRQEFPLEMHRIVAPDGQEAITEYRVLARSGSCDCSLLAFVLHTGRTHQIRVHMSHLGHPLLGDIHYGGPAGAIGRQALHCAAVRFPHVLTGEDVTVAAPLPEDFSAVLTGAGISWDEGDRQVVERLLQRQGEPQNEETEKQNDIKTS